MSQDKNCENISPRPPQAKNMNVKEPIELHVCMGLNCCKGHDRFGTNDCAGTGDCATVRHSCHTMNNCRSQGGCGLFGSAEEQNEPGVNDCAWRGSCASPIEAERIHLQGNKVKIGDQEIEVFKFSVWKHARLLFENRMKKIGREIGQPRFPDGPPSWWLNEQVGGFDACGESGPRAGSFGKDTLCEEDEK